MLIINKSDKIPWKSLIEENLLAKKSCYSSYFYYYNYSSTVYKAQHLFPIGVYTDLRIYWTSHGFLDMATDLEFYDNKAVVDTSVEYKIVGWNWCFCVGIIRCVVHLYLQDLLICETGPGVWDLS